MQLFKLIFNMSRPRFWLYLAGPYLIGFTAGVQSLADYSSWQFWYSLFYFLVPANIFLYGINDIFDEETDEKNEKKATYEVRSSLETRYTFILAVTTSLVFAIPFFFFLCDLNLLIFCGFLFLSFFYSSKPIRFKSKPFLDFSSNILYALPGFIGFFQISKIYLIDWPIILAAFCWTGALHLFSAIPDIKADSEAGIITTAIFLGYTKSLILCVFLWTISGLSVLNIHPIFIFSFIYPLLPFLLLIDKKIKIQNIYWIFPWINAYIGFLLYCFLILKVIDNPAQIIWPIVLEIIGTAIIIFFFKRK